MAAYLLKDGRGEFASHDVYDAWEGFQELGEEVRNFTEAMLHRGVLYNRPKDVVVGWVRAVSMALEQLGCPVPAPLDYPEELAPWLCRKIDLGTLASVADHPGAVFVKPASQMKLFDGRIISPGTTKMLSRYPEDTKVWISDVVTWCVEWRVYVLEGKILGAYPYRGDWRVAVAWDEVDRMVASWATAPVGYALDIGCLADGRTALIEANDAWALGNYGLLPKDYAALLRARWEQMVESLDSTS